MTKKTRSKALGPNALLPFSFCFPFLCYFGLGFCLPVGRVIFACYSSSLRVSKQKWQDMLKIFGGMVPSLWPPGYAYVSLQRSPGIFLAPVEFWLRPSICILLQLRIR